MNSSEYVSLENIYLLFIKSKGVSTDTRSLNEGQLFFALTGPNFDGNTMASKAIDTGASFAIIDNPNYAISGKTLLVEDSLKALQELATHHREQQQIPIIGITGSNGKTTTKELLQAVLSQKFKVHCTKGNYNNHIGVPLTILNASTDASVWLIEMGTNQPGDIAFLCSIAKPNYCLITNIGMAHLEKLINLDGVFQEKSALFDSVLSRSGILFINESDPYLAKYADSLGAGDSIVKYNFENCSYGKIKDYSLSSGLLSVSIKDTVNKKEIECVTQLFGSFNINNISAALTLGGYFGVDLESAVEAISSYVPSNMRSQVQETDHNTLVVDGYNANPSSMKASLGAFLDTAEANAVAIVGDMLELGPESSRYHKEILDMLLQSGVHFYVVGLAFSEIYDDPQHSFQNVDTLFEHLKQNTIAGKRVFIKGSRGVRLEKLLTVL